MTTYFTKTRIFQCVFRSLVSLAVAVIFCSSALATDPFPPTTIYQKDGQWRVDFLSGSRIDVCPKNRYVSKFRLRLEEAMPYEEFDKYVFKTSAGPDWAPYAIDYFIKIDGKAHFCARTWWGRRILINLVDFKQVDARPHEEVLNNAEQQWILKKLSAAVEKMPAGDTRQERREIKKLLTAVYQAGRMQVTRATSLLKKLELSEYVGSGGGLQDYRGIQAGDIHPFQCRTYTLRHMVQRTLRGLGEKPREDLPATQMHYLKLTKRFGSDALIPGEPYIPRKHTSSRHQRTTRIRAGMKPLEVLDILGPPDDLVYEHQQWRYDIDVDRPYTFLVTWKDLRTVEKTEKARPPLWQRSDRFDEHAKPVGWKAE